MSVRDKVPPPPWVADLPYATTATPECPAKGHGRGARVPVIAASASPGNQFSFGRGLTLGLRRRCAICGCALTPGRNVYNVDAEVTEATVDGRAMPPSDYDWCEELPGGIHVFRYTPGSAHASCIAYATLVCPWLRYQEARHRFTGEVRGKRGYAEILGFRSYGYIPEPPGGNPLEDWGWAYFDCVERIPIGNAGNVIGPIYDQVVAADAQVIDTSTRLYWRDDDTAPDIRKMGDIVVQVRQAASGPHRISVVP